MKTGKIDYPNIVEDESPSVVKFVKYNDLGEWRKSKTLREQYKRQQEAQMKEQEKIKKKNDELNYRRKKIRRKILEADEKGKKGIYIKKQKLPKIIKHQLKNDGYPIEKIKRCMGRSVYYIKITNDIVNDLIQNLPQSNIIL
jgi:hypothetical protein